MYITDLSAISPQKTFNQEILDGEFISRQDKKFLVIEPDYMEFIPKGLLRRMGKAIRMGIGASLPLIKSHKDIDGVLVGTAFGGLEDCIKFLNQIVEYDEGMLTPTNFVQSTPNAIAGQVALMGATRGYNITYTNGGLAFENALLDAFLLFEEKHHKLLIGGVEEISEYNYNIDFLAGRFKDELIADNELIASNTKGTYCGEGASFFILESEANEYLCQILDVAQITYPNIDDLDIIAKDLLKQNNLNISDIDSILLGYNGDIRHNSFYDYVGESIFPNANQYYFKHLTGDFRNCSSIGLWLLAHLIKGNEHLETSMSYKKKNDKKLKNVLLYNHFDTNRHSFILVRR